MCHFQLDSLCRCIQPFINVPNKKQCLYTYIRILSVSNLKIELHIIGNACAACSPCHGVISLSNAVLYMNSVVWTAV